MRDTDTITRAELAAALAIMPILIANQWQLTGPENIEVMAKMPGALADDIFEYTERG